MRCVYIFVKKNSHCRTLFRTCGRSEEIEGQALQHDMEELYICTYFYNLKEKKERKNIRD